MVEPLSPLLPVAPSYSPTGDASEICAETRGAAIASLHVRPDDISLGAPLPAPGRMTRGETFTLISTGPCTYFAVSDGADPMFGAQLAATAAGARIADQSGAYVLMRIHGGQARAILQKGVFIDLHPDVFTPHAAALTRCGRISVVLWRADEALEYGVAVPRSYARSFLDWFAFACRAGTVARRRDCHRQRHL
ncbi:MAG: hypothetical protein ABW199_09940 [Caulobacterales bacterium]